MKRKEKKGIIGATYFDKKGITISFDSLYLRRDVC